MSYIETSCHVNPKVDSPPFAATVAAAAPLQHYQVDTVHQPLGLTMLHSNSVLSIGLNIFHSAVKDLSATMPSPDVGEQPEL